MTLGEVRPDFPPSGSPQRAARDAAALSERDRAACTAAKSAFIRRIMELAAGPC